MSNINTNGIDATYPLPGVNNSTQGFRDNFSSIKQNLNIASAEITDLQSKAIVKASLDGFSINNNMANTLISNALVRNFRHTTFNLGSNLSGTITIDVSKGDVQYGTITANTIINFGGWMPSGTLGSVQLNLNIANANAVITLPVSSTDAGSKVVSGMLKSVLTLENYKSNSAPSVSSSFTNLLTVPYGVDELKYKISTIDCGTTLDIEPLNRPRDSVQVAGSRTVTAVGNLGDVPGTFVTNGANLYFCTGTYDGTTEIWKKVTLEDI